MKKYERMLKKPLGELLISRGVIDEDQLNKALEFQSENGGLIGEILIKLEFADEAAIAQALTAQYGLPFLPLAGYEFDKELVDVVPEDVARKFCFIPIDKIRNNLTIAIANPLDYKTLESIEEMTKCNIQIFVSTASDINEAIQKCYHQEEEKD